MAVERLDAPSVARETVSALGLQADSVELASEAALAASIRRAASFLCPVPPRRLIRAVVEALSGLPALQGEGTDQVEQLLEQLVACGDLLELPLEDSRGRTRHLFLGPPTYVRRSNRYILLGVRPEGAPLISDDPLVDIRYLGHLRTIRSHEAGPTDELLRAEGLTELRAEQWLRPPRELSAEQLVAAYTARLDAVGPARDLEGTRVLDPQTDARYYRGRWRPLKPGDRGQFVARRSQAFGADLWCFAEVANGTVVRLVDLPLDSALGRGSDEAWRLQAAIDALAGRPQRVRVRGAVAEGATVIELFSPPPSWMQRRLDLLGTPVASSRGALFSYTLSPADLDEELAFLESMMWLSVDRHGG